jgi:hypothetical protein
VVPLPPAVATVQYLNCVISFTWAGCNGEVYIAEEARWRRRDKWKSVVQRLGDRWLCSMISSARFFQNVITVTFQPDYNNMKIVPFDKFVSWDSICYLKD